MSSPLPPLYALRAFDIAALHGSYTRAAEALHVTPGAISRHIRTLEAHFRCQLFLRKGPRVELTDAGRALASQLRTGFVALESACDAFRTLPQFLRLKAPTTLTVNWLLQALKGFHERHSVPEVQVSSVWMDVDRIDFHREAFDCAILLGNGQFGEQTHALRLFAERLAPVCAPSLVAQAQRNLPGCDLIHPSADRRDWRRWLKDTPLEQQVDISCGHLFDTLEQGNQAAIAGHGVSVADLTLSRHALEKGVLALPFSRQVVTGDGYYLVWPEDSPRQKEIATLRHYLLTCVPECCDEQ